MTTKRIIHTSIGLLLATAFLAVMSTCGTVDTGNESSEATLKQSDASYPSEQENSAAASKEPSSPGPCFGTFAGLS